MIELAKRHENKYTIHRLDSMNLINKLDLLLSKDANTGPDGYCVTSLYYDTPHNAAYHDKVLGIAKRYKYRIRYYNDDRSVFKLEKKSKVQNMTHKESVWLSRDEVQQIMERDDGFLMEREEALCHEFYWACKDQLISPKSQVRYTRYAFLHPVGNLRVTFDDHIQISQTTDILADAEWIYALEPNEVVLEVKFNGLMPDFINKVLETATVTQSSVSKYVYSRKYNYAF